MNSAFLAKFGPPFPSLNTFQPDPLSALLAAPDPLLVLAPMQDVTDLPFMRLIHRYGGPDLYFTEYFRVHQDSVLDHSILASITQNPTGQPIIAQIIGNHIPSLVRIARELQQYPVAGIDLNLGCPVPVVYRKNAGGGLLRDTAQIDTILGALRDAIQIRFSVKTRIGFDDPDSFEQLLAVYARHSLDLLSVHARTVAEKYRDIVHYEHVARAVAVMPCPVIANGNIYSAQTAQSALHATNAKGLMIGRGAIRNPWLFRQIREHRNGVPQFSPCGRDVLQYVFELYQMRSTSGVPERSYVNHMKKYMNFLGLGVDANGRFLTEIRRVTTHAAFFALCHEFLDHSHPMKLDPFAIPFKSSDPECG